jgi:hypothetical protein
MEAVCEELAAAGVEYEMAWSPVLRSFGALTLGDADPSRYTHLVFVCGPLHGGPVEALHRRFSRCRRVAVGVSVIDPADPAAAGFHMIVPRDSPGAPPTGDLALTPQPRPVPVAGVILVGEQQEYARRARHGTVSSSLAGWLGGCGCALLPLDTRLDPRDWRLCGTPAELEAIIRRMDLVITMRMHGLVLALKHGVPTLAVDPVAGGAKVTAQARAWHWPAVVTAGPEGKLEPRRLDEWRDWCLSPAGRGAASRAAQAPPETGLRDLLGALGLPGPASVRASVISGYTRKQADSRPQE